MRLTSGLVMLLLSPLGGAQPEPQEDGKFQKPKNRPVESGVGNVTQGDVLAVLKKVEASFKYVLGVKIAPVTTVKPTATPVDRRLVVAEFARLRSVAGPAMRMKPRDAKFDAKRLTWQNPELLALIKGGYIAPLGPIATNKVGTLTPHEFGDALGYFLARIGEVTNQPSTKWTPYLQGPDAN